MGELRFLLAKRTGRVRPLAYIGAGAARYNLKTSPPQRTADVDPLGIAGIVPVGAGLQFVLGNSTALEILGGHTYSLADDLNGATTEKGNDVFWGLTVGLIFGNFGPGRAEPPVLEVPSPLVIAPPTEPEVDVDVAVETEAIEEVEEQPQLEPVVVATRGARSRVSSCRASTSTATQPGSHILRHRQRPRRPQRQESYRRNREDDRGTGDRAA